MSIEVEKRIAHQLTPPYVDPYGNPIPGLAALGIEETQPTEEGKAGPNRGLELSACVADGESVRVRLERIGERVQSDVALLGELARHGMISGSELGVERVGGSILLTGPDGGEVAVTEIVADQLHVTPLTHG